MLRSMILVAMFLLPIISDAPPPRGLVRDRVACGDSYRIEGLGNLIKSQICSHGPDNDDFGFDASLLFPRGPTPRVFCEGDGVDGYRVQMMYVREASQRDRYAENLGGFRVEISDMDRIFELSALKTGGRRRIRFVTSDCEIAIDNVVVPDGANDTFGGTMMAVRKLGYTSQKRKYVMFVDSKVYCGIGSVYSDRSSGADNKNNSTTGYARADSNCWAGIVIAHELIHTLGGVQTDAPNTSGGWHCTDEYDIMCYKDAPAYPDMVERCPTTQGHLLDCGNDDYYNTAPRAGSYLATHFNIATDSVFLITPAEPDLFVTLLPLVRK